MKKNIFLFLIVPLLFIGCKKVDVVVSDKPVKVETKATVVKECFSYDKDGNDISMQIETTGEEVFGALAYSLAGKDKNAGFLKGKWKKNMLLLDYTFLSEGKESTCQVAFEVRDGQLIEGYGEMNEDGTAFKDVAKLKFTSTMPLSKIDCPK